MVFEQFIYWAGYVLVLVMASLLYFRVAEYFKIIDKPNERSSHHHPVVRGGGVIFVLAVLIWFYYREFSWPWLVLGAVVIGVISFLDDVLSLNPMIRFLVQLLAVSLLFLELWPIHWPLYLLVLAVIVCIGTLNAFNFMDGINGITGVYGLVCLITLGYIQWKLLLFTDLTLILMVSQAVLVFLFFNFRVRARCFAGDVGSVTLSFMLIFFLLQLIQATHNFLWPLLFLVYGLDSVITIVERLKKRENVFKPHRTHLYQYLANELKWSHRHVALLYGGAQALFNSLVITALFQRQYFLPMVMSAVYVILYLVVRHRVVNLIRLRGAA